MSLFAELNTEEMMEVMKDYTEREWLELTVGCIKKLIDAQLKKDSAYWHEVLDDTQKIVECISIVAKKRGWYK